MKEDKKLEICNNDEREGQKLSDSTEAVRTLYKVTISNLSKNIALHRNANNEQFSLDLDKDIDTQPAASLKCILQEAEGKIAGCEDKLRTLEEKNATEKKILEDRIAEMEEDYRIMHSSLTADIKILTGKLNLLQKYQLEREGLMKKFEDCEAEMLNQEIRHKKQIYEIERKHLIGRYELKKYIEGKLNQLSEGNNNVDILLPIKRDITENLAYDYELNTILVTHQRLNKENEQLKDRNGRVKSVDSLNKVEKKKQLSKAEVQYKIIESLLQEYEDKILTLSKN